MATTHGFLRFFVDDNCLFHALSRQIERLPSTGRNIKTCARELRRVITNWLTENLNKKVDDGGFGEPATVSSFMTPDPATYLENMRQHGGGRCSWGDALCVRAAATVLEARIIVFSTLGSQPVVNEPFFSAVQNTRDASLLPELYLGHYAEQHYVSAVPLAESLSR